MRDEKRSRRRVFTCWQGSNDTRDILLAWPFVFAVNTNRAFGPGDVVNFNDQSFLTAMPTIIDQPEERVITRILDLAEHWLNFL